MTSQIVAHCISFANKKLAFKTDILNMAKILKEVLYDK